MPRFIADFAIVCLAMVVPGLLGLVGCAGNQPLASHALKPVEPAFAEAIPASDGVILAVASNKQRPAISRSDETPASGLGGEIRPVGGETPETNSGTLTIDGRQYKLQLVDPDTDATGSPKANVVTAEHSLAAFQHNGVFSSVDPELAPIPLLADSDPENLNDSQAAATTVGPGVNLVDLNLPSALAMISGQHPAVGFARWRVQEAYAQLSRAKSLWLPSIQAGVSFHRHDGNYQASDGSIIDVNRNSFQYGLGAGATGAGTTNPRPGIAAQFHLADALFQPKIAKNTAWARGHKSAAVVNQQLLGAASAYIELVDAHQDARIMEESRDRMSELSKITRDFAEAGEGLNADADRMKTELNLTDNRLIAARERIAVASARLAHAISLDARSQIMPMDVTAVPLDLIAVESDKGSLISTGLSTRPELKESQALVAAACEAYKREKYAPFVPSVLLGFSTGGFGGGVGNDIKNVDGRYDIDALVTWEVRNLGFGERAARRETSARIQQARFEKLRVMDQVALDISESYSQVQFRHQQIAITQQAIQTAEDSYTRNLERIRDGQGLPIEVLQSVQALEAARRAYLNAVVSYNQAQFRLQWALGWPVSAS